MSYEDLKRIAAIICKTRLVASRHEFNDVAVWLLQEVAALDPTLRSILDAEPKMSFEGSTANVPWRRVPYQDEGEE